MTPTTAKNLDDFVIRKARPDEAETVIEMLELTSRTLLENNIIQWPVGMFTSPEGRQQIHDGTAAGRYFMVDYRSCTSCSVSEEPAGQGAEIAGLFLLNDEDPFDALLWKGFAEDWLDALYLHRLLVKEPFQGCGLTGKVMAFAEDRVRQMGRHFLRLDCLAGNLPLRRFYKEKCRGKGKGGMNELTTVWNPELELEFARYELRVAAEGA
ncbi:hypothetical protein EMPS_03992 [Entomortierella parvispora]|uniref:N-acetyltransferase domain-containing protein n=1 Tax=Entomortierella parvispora TaxID=205924 RepID=A0A9P3H8G1_9FUNG|nr:hypothetical protein EMPS_03992 [Entomortierella parvispora]